MGELSAESPRGPEGLQGDESWPESRSLVHMVSVTDSPLGVIIQAANAGPHGIPGLSSHKGGRRGSRRKQGGVWRYGTVICKPNCSVCGRDHQQAGRSTSLPGSTSYLQFNPERLGCATAPWRAAMLGRVRLNCVQSQSGLEKSLWRRTLLFFYRRNVVQLCSN